mgnify:FL=1
MIGDIMLDRYVTGIVERISPEAPIPVVREAHSFSRLGGASNVMQNIQLMGGDVHAFGVVGDDEAGEEITQQLQQHRIHVDGVLPDPSRRTTIKTRIISGGQQLLRIDKEDTTPLSLQFQQELIDKVQALFSGNRIDALILEDYAKGVLSEGFAQTLVDLANQYHVPALLDPNLRNPMRIKNLSLLKPNRNEAYALSDTAIQHGDLDEVRSVAKKIMTLWSTKSLLITLAQEGMLLFTADGLEEHIPTAAREVYDVSGAGDTVIAATALALAANADMHDAAMLGNIAAGVAVGKLGTAAVSSEELMAEIMKIQVAPKFVTAG